MLVGSMDQKSFSARAAIDNDFSLTVPMLIPLFAWIIYLCPLVVKGVNTVSFYLAIAATLAGPLLMLLKLLSIRRVIRDGQVVTGVVRSAPFIKDRGRINFSYAYGGQDYESTIVVHASKRARTFEAGKEVEVALNPEKPGQAYLRGLYT